MIQLLTSAGGDVNAVTDDDADYTASSVLCDFSLIIFKSVSDEKVDHARETITNSVEMLLQRCCQFATTDNNPIHELIKRRSQMMCYQRTNALVHSRDLTLILIQLH